MYWKVVTEEKKVNKYGIPLYRIECVKALPARGIKAGDKGGWVQKVGNLSGNTWLFDQAEVFENAVAHNCEVRDNARICNSAEVSDSTVSGDAKIYCYAKVSQSVIKDKALIYAHADVSRATIGGNAEVFSEVYGGEWIFSPFQLQGSVHIVCETRMGFLKIGCLDEISLEVWQRDVEKIGMERAYTPAQVEEYKMYIELYAKVLQIRKNEVTNPF